MKAGSVARRVLEWIALPTALREARAGLTAGNDHRPAALRQAKLLLEVIRRLEQPTDALPPGALPPVTLALYRDAIYWALAARHAGAPPADLRGLWDAGMDEALATSAARRAALDGATVAALRRTLVDEYDPRALTVSEEDVARARPIAEALVWDADAPRRRVQWVLAQRWLRLSAVALVLLLIAGGVRALVQGRDLAAGKPFRLSKDWPGWKECVASGECVGLMFHTAWDENPWVEIDLGAPKTVHRVDVVNRSSCCEERAVPLVLELSTDRSNWTLAARRNETFDDWRAAFSPRTARYVRLKVLKSTIFHLKSIAVR